MVVIKFCACGARPLGEGLELGLCALQVLDSCRQVCICFVDCLDEEINRLKVALDFAPEVRKHPHVEELTAIDESVNCLGVLVDCDVDWHLDDGGPIRCIGHGGRAGPRKVAQRRKHKLCTRRGNAL